MSGKTIADRLTVIRRIPDAATITSQGVDRFLTSTAWAKATRANYHGAIRAWSKWLINTGRRSDDPTLIATTPKVKKGRPRPVADEHLAILLDTRMYKRTRAMILLRSNHAAVAQLYRLCRWLDAGSACGPLGLGAFAPRAWCVDHGVDGIR